MRQFTLVRKHLPSRVKAWRPAEPRFEILLKIFLGFQIFRDDDESALRKLVMAQGGQKWMGGAGDIEKRQWSSRFQALDKGLPGGNLQQFSKPFAGR
jgi:hypothetical protein